ncbi:MAG: hypothetical protein ACYTFH_04465 [Planctomycetota bacterium]|jgi:hypothetical protein
MASPDGARVASVDSLERFRTSLQEFIFDARNAISEADAEVQRVLVWLERDRKFHWQQRLKKANEELVRAKSALFIKQNRISTKDRPPSAVDEKLAVKKWQAAVAEAEHRLRRIKHWSVHLGQEAARYKGAIAGLSAVLDRELPASVEMLKRAVASLEAYLHTKAPDLRALVEGIPTIEAVAASGGGSSTPSSAASGGHDLRSMLRRRTVTDAPESTADTAADATPESPSRTPPDREAEA